VFLSALVAHGPPRLADPLVRQGHFNPKPDPILLEQLSKQASEELNGQAAPMLACGRNPPLRHGLGHRGDTTGRQASMTCAQAAGAARHLPQREASCSAHQDAKCRSCMECSIPRDSCGRCVSGINFFAN